jgi:hypothetical protein
MQCRVNDVTVNETPKFMVPDPTDQTHAMTLTDPANPSQTITLPLELRGVILFLNVRTVTADQFNDQDTYPHISLTSDTLTWDPSTTLYRNQELAMTNLHGEVCTYANVRGPRTSLVINSISSTYTDHIDITHDDNFHQASSSNFVISSLDTGMSMTGNVRARKAPGVNSVTLSKRWCISPQKAQRTLTKTTQRGVCKCLDPTLSRRFPTNDQMLRYKRMPHPCFTDTLIAGTPSKQGNKYAQAYCTSFGWTRAHPMKRKGDAHETLSLLFHRDGVPPVMIMDGSKEQTLGDFCRKLRQADCHQGQTKPYFPWMNAAEGCIRELKRGTSRKMLKTSSPWDHCIELGGYICSCTVNDIYETHSETLETVMTGNTADISHICEFGWYDWVMFCDNVPSFPDNKMTLGRYLEPAIDVGSALTAMILKSNGTFACQSTFRHLTDEETHCTTHARMRSEFDASIGEILGQPARDGGFPAEDLTPDHNHYDPCDYDPDVPDLEVKVTPEANDPFVGAEVCLPLGGILKKGRVASRKWDADGNPDGFSMTI